MAEALFKPLGDFVLLEIYDNFGQYTSARVLGIGPFVFEDPLKPLFEEGDEVLTLSVYVQQKEAISPRLIAGDGKGFIMMIRATAIFGVMNKCSPAPKYESVEDFINRVQ
jgi:hypothetical protein